MPTTAIANIPNSYEDILDAIEAICRDHLLAYRVELGRLLLDQFWHGDAHAFSRRATPEEARFEDFFASSHDELQRYGISQRQARDSVRVAIVVATLPATLSTRVGVGQVLELTRLHDPSARARVMLAALEHNWSTAQMRDAVDVAMAMPDADAAALAAAVAADADAGDDADASPPAAGRMVARAERLARDVADWSATWRQVDASRLRGGQRQRLQAARAALKSQVAALDALLG